MKFNKRFLMLSMALAGALAAGPNAYAEDNHGLGKMLGHDEDCRAGVSNPLVGIWSGNLKFTLPPLGSATVLISINQGGTFTETDSIDLNNTVGNASPGYAAWKANDCRHYTLTIDKMLYNPLSGEFSKVILPGNFVLSEDGDSLTVNLSQKVFNQAGALVGTGTVTGSAQRVKAGSAE